MALAHYVKKSSCRSAPFSAWGLLALLAAPTVLMTGCAGDTLQLAGTVERTALELAAPSAEIIDAIPVSRGTRVSAGQIVVQLDTEVADAELRAFEAGLAAAQAALREGEREMTRAQGLRRSGVATPQALDRAQRARDEARAAVAEKEARLAQARRRLEDLTLRARTAGIVDQLPFEVGERIPAGAIAAVVLADEPPWVRVWLPARAVAQAKPGTRAQVSVEGRSETFEGHLEDVGREAEFTPHYALTERESAHLVYQARVVLDNAPADLRPGLPAQVRLRLGAGSAAPGDAPATQEQPRTRPPQTEEPPTEEPHNEEPRTEESQTGEPQTGGPQDQQPQD